MLRAAPTYFAAAATAYYGARRHFACRHSLHERRPGSLCSTPRQHMNTWHRVAHTAAHGHGALACKPAAPSHRRTHFCALARRAIPPPPRTARREQIAPLAEWHASATSRSPTCRPRAPLRARRPRTRSVERVHAAPTVRPRHRSRGHGLTAHSCGSRRPLARPPGGRTARHMLAGGGVRVLHLLAASARAPPPPRSRGGSARAHLVDIVFKALFLALSRRRGDAAPDQAVGLLLLGAGKLPCHGCLGDRGSHRGGCGRPRYPYSDDSAVSTYSIDSKLVILSIEKVRRGTQFGTSGAQTPHGPSMHIWFGALRHYGPDFTRTPRVTRRPRVTKT